MTYGYIRPIAPPGELKFVEFIAISPADGIERPQPEPPKPTHPIALPGDPWWGSDLKPTHPIMLPGMPGWPDVPEEPGRNGTPAYIMPMPALPEGTPPPVPPAGIPADSTLSQLLIQNAAAPVPVWIPPYASHHAPKK